MQLEHAIRTRRTHKAFAPDPVGAAALDELFELARRAPNHHLTNPWRSRVLGERTPRAADRVGRGNLGTRVQGQRTPAREPPPRFVSYLD